MSQMLRFNLREFGKHYLTYNQKAHSELHLEALKFIDSPEARLRAKDEALIWAENLLDREERGLEISPSASIGCQEAIRAALAPPDPQEPSDEAV